jgi:hypothetical protein
MTACPSVMIRITATSFGRASSRRRQKLENDQAFLQGYQLANQRAISDSATWRYMRRGTEDPSATLHFRAASHCCRPGRFTLGCTFLFPEILHRDLT